ncbi:MAG TPA: hypothetical protein VJB14_16335 [Planctomycetota bacterium]|nr:hypothetical protein [Planctomycetota bacterium]
MKRITNQESRISPGWGWRILAPAAILLAAVWPRVFAALFLRKP